jgi:hypothetical protein
MYRRLDGKWPPHGFSHSFVLEHSENIVRYRTGRDAKGHEGPVPRSKEGRSRDRGPTRRIFSAAIYKHNTDRHVSKGGAEERMSVRGDDEDRRTREERWNRKSSRLQDWRTTRKNTEGLYRRAVLERRNVEWEKCK